MWNKTTLDALDTWLGRDTWYTGHALDDGRFMDFILAVWDEHGRLWDESFAREIMERKVRALHQGFDEETLTKTINDKKQDGTVILEFLSHVTKAGRTL